MSTTLTGAPTATSTNPAASSSGSSGGGGGPTSSPLLFFVALGFGVVFTNLWIIVGVKYCFRYSQRNRQGQQDENGEPIDMTAMPRTHRRRREKKLMTMDEVNERFPLVKYKAWMTSRAEEGLPTAGGVNIPSQSRAASLRNVDGVIGDARKSHDISHRPITPDPKASSDEEMHSPESAKTSIEVTHITPETSPEPEPASKSTVETSEKKDPVVETPAPTTTIPTTPITAPNTAAAESSTAPLTTHVTTTSSQDAAEDDLDDDDQIQMAVPTEMLANPGDSCAICIDTLEDDDDVRGLSCGHAFHASCLDPWLTSRRACCPLCKADYYVPKPRPEGADAAEAERQERRGRGTSGRPGALPSPPGAFVRGGSARFLFPGRFRPTPTDDGQRPPRGFYARFPRTRRYPVPRPYPEIPVAVEEQAAPQQATWRSRMRHFVQRPSASFRGRTRQNNETTQEATPAGTPEVTTTEPTPSALEAGQR